jgi:hypothetical protein
MSGLLHSLPQMSQKKLNEKHFSFEWSVERRVSGLLISLILTVFFCLPTCKIFRFWAFWGVFYL